MKQKRLKSILSCVLVLSMVFGVQSVAFATGTDDTVVQQEVTDIVTEPTDVAGKTNDAENTDTAGKNNENTDTEGEPPEANSGIAPASVDDDIAPLSDDTMSGDCGATENDNVTWKLEQNNEDSDNPTYTLTISGNGAMADYENWTNDGVEDIRPWKDYLTTITKIEVGEGITRIGDRAFHFGYQIGSEQRPFSYEVTITFPETLKEIGEEACVRANIKSIDIPENVTTLDVSAFYQCKNLVTITGLEGVTSIGGYVFYGCESVSSKLSLTSATSIGASSFQGCKALTEISIPNVTVIENSAFNGCSALSGNIELTEVREVGQSAFQNCASITSISLPKVTSIPWGLVKDCTSLKSITLNANITSIANEAFKGCTALESLDYGGASVTIANYLFNGYTNLTTVTGLENATVGEYAFNNCTALKSVTFGENATVAGTALNGCRRLETVDFAGADVTVISSMFETTYDTNGTCTRGYPNLKSVTGLKNAKTTDGAAWNRAFINCKALETIDFDGASIAFGSYIFTGCENLTTLSGMENVTALTGEGTIRSMQKLGAFTVPAAITSINTLYLFNACPALKVIDFTTVSNLSGVQFTAGSSTNTNIVFTKSCDDAAIYVKDMTDASAISSYAINYPTMVTNGGTFTNDIQFTENTTFAIPTKANYKFLGWYDNEDCTGTPVTTAEAGKTYYAGWEPKTESTISFKEDAVFNKAYNGSEYIVSKNNYEVTGSTGDVTFAYQTKDGDEWKDLTSAPVGAGEYRVKAIVAEDDNYASAETDWKEFSILKATPAYTAPTNLTATVGQTLADVTLPEGFAWQDDTTTFVGDAGMNTFKVTYTPEDTDNYSVVENIDVTLKVYQKAEIINVAPVIMAEDKTLTVGDTFNAMDGVTASDKEDGDLTNKITVESNNVDTANAGTYTVTYKVEDSKGAGCMKTIYVTVKAKDTQNPTTDGNNNQSGTDTDKNTNTTGTDKTTSNSVQTGDTANMTLWIALVVLSGGLLAVASGMKRKRKPEK